MYCSTVQVQSECIRTRTHSTIFNEVFLSRRFIIYHFLFNSVLNYYYCKYTKTYCWCTSPNMKSHDQVRATKRPGCLDNQFAAIAKMYVRWGGVIRILVATRYRVYIPCTRERRTPEVGALSTVLHVLHACQTHAPILLLKHTPAIRTPHAGWEEWID